MGDMGGVPAPGGEGLDDVWPDDGRVVDLHRHAGHPPGDLRNLRGDRPQAVPRFAGRNHHPDRRPRRDGRRATARRDAERRCGDLRGGRPRANAAPARPSISRRARRRRRTRTAARPGGSTRAFDYPGFVPAYIRPLFCEGKGPFRWVALSGDPADIAATDRAIVDEFSDDPALVRWIKAAGERVRFQGLPARICWLGYGERARAGHRFNELVRSGAVKAPIVIGRDHLDSGSVASPYRETESMLDGSDAIADWPILNALLNTSSGASWVSVHHGGGVGIGRSIHAGMVVVADGSDAAAKKLERVLTNDPGSGVMRHADAGYERAIEVANERGVRIPMNE